MGCCSWVPIVGDALEDTWEGAVDIVEDVVGTVVDVVEDIPGDVSDVVESVGGVVTDALDYASNMVSAIADDPKKLAAIALAIMVPGAGLALGTSLGFTGTAAAFVGNIAINTALNGGNIEQAVISSAIPIAGKEIAGVASAGFAAEGFSQTASKAMGEAVTTAGISIASGKDPVQALLDAGMTSSLVTQNIGEYLGAEGLVASKALGTAVLSGAVSASKGDDVLAGTINGAIAGSLSGLKEQRIVDIASASDVAAGMSDEYGSSENYDKFMQTAIADGLVGDPAAVAEMADAAAGLSTEYGSSFTYDVFMDEAIRQGTVGKAPEISAAPMGLEQSPDNTDFTNTIASYDTTNTLKTDSSGENYGLEGRNYPTEESTQGTGGSPVTSSMLNLPDITTNSLIDVDPSKLLKVALGAAGAVGVAKAVTTTKAPTSFATAPVGDIYKNAPITGFRMVKMKNEQGGIKYIPFIGSKAQLPTAGLTKMEELATGGFITRR